MKKTESKQIVLNERYSRHYEKQKNKAQKTLANRKKISKYIRKARKFIERLHNLPKFEAFSNNICNLCDLLSDYIEGIYEKAPIATIIAVLGGLIYLVWPFDAIPDIPFIGWVDDAAVLSFIVAAEQNDVREYLGWKSQHSVIDVDEITTSE